MERRQILIPLGTVVAIAGMSLIFGRGGEPGPIHLATAHTGEMRPGDSLAAPGVPEQVTEFLRNGQSWRAARAMREFLGGSRRDPAAVLLAARAEAGWGGWPRVREYLEGQPWLGQLRGGEGWYFLGRALEEADDPNGALSAYGEYLRAEPMAGQEDQRLVAELRRGLILLRQGDPATGADLLEGMREHAPDLEPWIDLLAAEALAEAGDTARVRELVGRVDAAEMWLRGRHAILTAHERAGDPAAVRDLAHRFRGQAGSAAARSDFSLTAARAALALGDTAAARADLRAALEAAPSSAAARAAADLLPRTGGVTRADRLAIAGVLDRHGAETRAAAEYRAWLAGDGGSAAERKAVRLRLGRALFAAGQYGAAVAALKPLTAEAGATGAEALLMSGRAEYRRGNRNRATEIWMDLARRHPRSGSGAEGLFLIADISHDAGEVARARRIYRRVASEFPGTDRAGLSLMRLAGAAYQQREWNAAARVWDEYRASYPRGDRWLEATYWAARARERAGDAAAARSLYAAARARDPLSYYALLSARRLDEPFWPITLAPSPEDDPEARSRVQGWMHGIDLLNAAGLHAEAELEADRWIRQAGDDPILLYPLAEALNERGLTVRGIRIGLRLQREAARPNLRLLRIVYPFPYRPMVHAEAGEKRLDPSLVAALTRQESLFKARISSPVGARGLMQIMPETGSQLARAARIEGWDPELLYQPEINVHLGTMYLADQMRRYDGSLPAVFSAYNAGPHRIDRWIRIMPEWGDEELFTERIPYRETREYVKILTRNIALYEALYPG